MGKTEKTGKALPEKWRQKRQEKLLKASQHISG